jgi:hypothetical protein
MHNKRKLLSTSILALSIAGTVPITPAFAEGESASISEAEVSTEGMDDSGRVDDNATNPDDSITDNMNESELESYYESVANTTAEGDITAPVPTGETGMTLSPEQIAAGYQIIDGKYYAPGQAPGQTQDDGMHEGGVAADQTTGYVTFTAEMPEGVHSTAYINVINMNTYEEYQVALYEANHWTNTIALPNGVYILDEAGLFGDTDHRFWAEINKFEVTAGSSHVESYVFKDSAAETPSDNVETAAGLGENGGKESKTAESGASASATPEPVNVLPSAQTKAPNKILSVISVCLFTVIPIAGILFIRKKFKKPKRGFDE